RYAFGRRCDAAEPPQSRDAAGAARGFVPSRAPPSSTCTQTSRKKKLTALMSAGSPDRGGLVPSEPSGAEGPIAAERPGDGRVTGMQPAALPAAAPSASLN